MGTEVDVRKIDELGRIVLPREMREYLDLKICDAVEILEQDNMILLQKSSLAKDERLPENMRRIDELGRILLPKETRIRFTLKPKDSLKVRLDSCRMILEKCIPNL